MHQIRVLDFLKTTVMDKTGYLIFLISMVIKLIPGMIPYGDLLPFLIPAPFWSGPQARGSSRTTAVGSSRVHSSSSALFAFSQARGGEEGGSSRGANRFAFGSSCSFVLWPSPSDLSVE